MNPKIHIVVLNWNGSKYLRECIESLKSINYSNYIITVIDNNSIDNSILSINDLEVNLVSHNHNYKYAIGYNKAIFNIKNDNSEFYLLLNNDTICDKEILNAFIEAIKKYGHNSIMGAKILYTSNKNRIWYAGGKFGFSNFFVSHRGIRQMDSEKYSHDLETDYITGCCILVSKESFFSLKGFNESFDMYGEDVDFSIRAQKLGLKCYYISKAKLWHNVSSSYGGQYSVCKNIKKFSSLFKLLLKHPKTLILRKSI